MAQYARPLGLPVVMDFVDVDSDKWRQYAERGRPPMSWLYRSESRRLQAAESDIARWARICLLATQAEESLLKSFAPWARSAVIPNGIDLDYYTAVPPSGQPVVMFTGAMDYMPNVDAVSHFCADILPRVRRQVPEARFYIVGLNPTPEVRGLARMAGITVTGAVPDVRPYYARASVCVAPLRIGRGIQNKVLQGMAMGLPLVVSTLAGRGLDAQPGRHLEMADDPDAFAAHVVRYLKRPDEGRALGRNGRALVEANFGWERAFRELDRILPEAAGRGGAPLRHPPLAAAAARQREVTRS
jgi:sugar transferase (PEP-CTERM/EpsH1 system associated)